MARFTNEFPSDLPDAILSSSVKSINYALLFFGCVVFHITGTWSLPLIDRDEPRFAEASREMIERGNYIVPYFNNELRLDKPPLTYWVQVASYRIFGESDFAARFPSAIAAALTAVLILAWGRRIGGEKLGWWAAIIFTLSLQTFVHAKAAVADMWLVLFVTLAHWAGYELIQRPTPNAQRSMKAATEIDPQLVKQLREKTNAGFMDCKRALVESGGDLAKAETILRTKGIATAGKKAARATKEGIVASYIHLQGKVGVLVEVNCETDFVARNENFREFVKDITLHIAAAHPLYVSRADVPANLIEAEREIYKAQVKGKPDNVSEKIIEGKLEKFYSTVSLLEQAFIKNPDVTIKDLLTGKIAELGENIVIRRFVRYLVGEPMPSEA